MSAESMERAHYICVEMLWLMGSPSALSVEGGVGGEGSQGLASRTLFSSLSSTACKLEMCVVLRGLSGRPGG